jgi:hypothetical protein
MGKDDCNSKLQRWNEVIGMQVEPTRKGLKGQCDGDA